MHESFFEKKTLLWGSDDIYFLKRVIINEWLFLWNVLKRENLHFTYDYYKMIGLHISKMGI